MNKTIKKLMAFGLLFAVAGLCPAAQTDDSTLPVGRDDPFGGGFGEVLQEGLPEFPVEQQMTVVKPLLFVETVTLKFLRASNLKIALDKMLSDYGAIAIDSNTNSLIICDTENNLQKIKAEITKADQTPSQIMIEVVIVDVQLKNDTEIGVDWDLLSTDNKNAAYRQSLIYPGRLSIVRPTDITLGDATAFQNVGLGSELSIINNDIRNVVNLLQEKRNIDILASPRVMVVSGQKAVIRSIRDLPYIELAETTGGSLLQSAQFKQVGVTLSVKATLTPEGKIILEVIPEQSVDTGAIISNVPVVDTRGVSTTLIMDDGQVVVMGGLRRKEIKHVRDQVPILGDIPIIGLLFSNDRKIVENSELLLLLSPHIYKGEPVPQDAMARFKEVSDQPVLALPPESREKRGTKDEGRATK